MRLSSSLPNLLILGNIKSGTSSLFRTLSQHDRIFASSSKEPAFFVDDRLYAKGLDWYAASFFSGSENYPIRMEATSTYLAFGAITSPKIKVLDKYVKSKFIIIFREPVSRAYSHYWMRRANGKEKLSFEDAIAMELRAEAHSPQIRLPFTATILNYGNYGSNLKPFLDSFEKSRFLFLLFEDLLISPKDVYRSILRFLQMDPSYEFDFLHENKAYMPTNRILFSTLEAIRKSKLAKFGKELFPSSLRVKYKKTYLNVVRPSFAYPPMSHAARARLKDYYRDEIFILQNMIGIDLSSWYLSDD